MNAPSLPGLQTLPSPVRTPLLRSEGLWIKAERAQPGGSVKYRMVHAKLGAAIRQGTISRSTILTEVTSGSTGVALALAARALNLKAEIHAFTTILPAKARHIRELGADLRLHPPETPLAELLGRVRDPVRAGTHWHLNQYDRTTTPAAYRILAGELADQLERADADPRRFFCPVGSGGLIQGVGAVLRERFPEIQVIAIEPAKGAVIDGMRNTRLVRLGPDDPHDPDFPDGRVEVPPVLEQEVVDGQAAGDSGSAAIGVARRAALTGAVVLVPD